MAVPPSATVKLPGRPRAAAPHARVLRFLLSICTEEGATTTLMTSNIAKNQQNAIILFVPFPQSGQQHPSLGGTRLPAAMLPKTRGAGPYVSLRFHSYRYPADLAGEEGTASHAIPWPPRARPPFPLCAHALIVYHAGAAACASCATRRGHTPRCVPRRARAHGRARSARAAEEPALAPVRAGASPVNVHLEFEDTQPCGPLLDPSIKVEWLSAHPPDPA